MPAVVDLKEPITTVVRVSNDVGVQFAFASSNGNCSFLEVVWPDFTDDLNDLFLGVRRRID